MKKKKLRLVLLLAAATFFSAAQAGAPYQPPFDPKRKTPGEECKSSDECQRHHRCEPKGQKSFCVAPPASKLPPGIVT